MIARGRTQLGAHSQLFMLPPKNPVRHEDCFDSMGTDTGPAYYTGWTLKHLLVGAEGAFIYRVGEYDSLADTYELSWPD